jgi:hypothetical protein
MKRIERTHVVRETATTKAKGQKPYMFVRGVMDDNYYKPARFEQITSTPVTFMKAITVYWMTDKEVADCKAYDKKLTKLRQMYLKQLHLLDDLVLSYTETKIQ